MTEVKKSTVRLSDSDLTNIRQIVASGAAANDSEAIRVALAEYARVAPRMKAIERKLNEIAPNPMGGYALPQLLTMVKTQGLDRLAAEELLRRGFFPDGLGNWVENRPDATIRASAASAKGGLRRGR